MWASQHGRELWMVTQQNPHESDMVSQHSSVNSDRTICYSEISMAASALWSSQHDSENSMPSQHPSHDSAPESLTSDRTIRAGSQDSMESQQFSYDYDTASVHSSQYPVSSLGDNSTVTGTLSPSQHGPEMLIATHESPYDSAIASTHSSGDDLSDWDMMSQHSSVNSDKTMSYSESSMVVGALWSPQHGPENSMSSQQSSHMAQRPRTGQSEPALRTLWRHNSFLTTTTRR